MMAALAVGKLHGAQAVAGRRQPRGLDVEGEKLVARKGLFEVSERGGYKSIEVTRTQTIFSAYLLKVNFYLVPINLLKKITLRKCAKKCVLGPRSINLLIWDNF
jgi:hypothetical protein